MDDNRSCETCAHSSSYVTMGYLLCLGPVDVIFCEDVEQPCECWEKAEDENDGENE